MAYPIIEYYTNILNGYFEPKIKELGEQGWELVCILPISGGNNKFIFKRIKI